MNRSFLLLLSVILLTSCMAHSRRVELSDSGNENQVIKLMQNVIARSNEQNEKLTSDIDNLLSLVYSLEMKKNERPVMFLDVKIKTTAYHDDLDSVMFLNLGTEKIRMATEKNKIITDNADNQLRTKRFMIPENLWVSIVFAKKTGYGFDIGKEGFEVKLNTSEAEKLKDFFKRAIQIREKKFPAIPEGQKKW